MKILFALLAALFSLNAIPTHACDMPEGFHEFVTFGDQAIYLSHYPMFGSIHSYQIVLKADFTVQDKNVNDQFFQFRKNHPNISLSTSPVRSDGEESYAVLPNYAQTGFQFDARVHYKNAQEKEVSLFKKVKVTITQVVLNRLMNQPKVGQKAPTELSYFYFGNEREAYLIHQLYWNPDFDQVVQVQPIAKVCATQNPTILTIAEHKNVNQDRVQSNDSFHATSSCGESVQIKALNEIYEDAMTIQH